VLIRDAVHGDIRLGPAEGAILDSPALQRLRGIKQLGTAYLVYPGCTHTRFEHSLGTCHVAHRICEHLRRNGAPIDAAAEERIGAAALLHDVTHAPFGHTLEDERCLFPRHDKGVRLSRLLAGPLGDTLERLGCRAEVASLLAAGDSSAPAWMRQIVSSTIDADLLDYLRRDSYHAGIAQAYDDRLFSYFAVEGDQLAIQMTRHGMERSDARSETVQLLRMRYFLTERIYYHHTKVAAGAMVSKAVELAQEHGALPEEEIVELTDAGLFQRLASVPHRDAPDPHILRLVDGLARRQLLKRGYVVSALTVTPREREALVARYHADRATRREAEERIARALGCRAGEVILYCPALTVMKEAAAVVRLPSGLCRLNEGDGDRASEIRALEERYAQLWRFYLFVPPEHVGRAAEVGREMFGVGSEWQPPNLPITRSRHI
jgi:hypothetical protein